MVAGTGTEHVRGSRRRAGSGPAEPRHDRAAQRSVRRSIVAAAEIASHVLRPGRRPERLRWGCRPDDPPAGLPGEDVVAAPTWEHVHAISIEAPPEDVWPWIAQIGQGRGGFYSFERLENAFGCRITNADAVRPEFQDPHVGDEIRIHPRAPAYRVAVVEPGRSLVLRGAGPDAPPTIPDSAWCFHVLPDGPGRSRLLEINRTVHGPGLAARLSFGTALVEPIGFVMGREMLRGIKERAEAGRRSAPPAGAAADPGPSPDAGSAPGAGRR